MSSSLNASFAEQSLVRLRDAAGAIFSEPCHGEAREATNADVNEPAAKRRKTSVPPSIHLELSKFASAMQVIMVDSTARDEASGQLWQLAENTVSEIMAAITTYNLEQMEAAMAHIRMQGKMCRSELMREVENEVSKAISVFNSMKKRTPEIENSVKKWTVEPKNSVMKEPEGTHKSSPPKVHCPNFELQRQKALFLHLKDVNVLGVNQLKDELKAYNRTTAGLKPVLVERVCLLRYQVAEGLI